MELEFKTMPASIKNSHFSYHQKALVLLEADILITFA